MAVDTTVIFRRDTAADQWSPAFISNASGFLNNDGAGNLSWSSVTVPSGASPTATVGLTVIPGVAATFMRSDAAPALNQTIAPTWTGVHTWNQSLAASTAGSATILANPTASTSGNPRWSPAIEWDGSTFESGANKAFAARAFLQTVNNSDVASWVLQTKIATAAWFNTMTLDFSGNLTISGNLNAIGIFIDNIQGASPSNNILIVDDGSGNMAAQFTGNLYFQPNATGFVNAPQLSLGNGSGTLAATSLLNLKPLPTSATGLNSGDVWNNGGVLHIV